jgi:hypothetical protein
MAGPNYGAIGATFKIVRILQGASLIAIIGMTANFISEIVSANQSPPKVLIGTLSVTCIAVLYCAITFILFMDNALPFLVNTGMDGLLLIAVIVVAVTVGKPLSYLNCRIIGKLSDDATSAYAFTAALGNSVMKEGGRVNYSNWIGSNKSTCLEMKSIWGLSIALCVLLFLSAVCSVSLWRRSRVLSPAPEKGEA